MQRIALVMVLCVSSVVARADSRAWTAAKKLLPANVAVIAGLDAAHLRSSDLYKQLMPLVLARDPDIQKGVDQLKTTCGLDAASLLDSGVVGVDADGKGAIVIALHGATRLQLESCAGKIVKANGATLAISTEGSFTRYHLADGKDLYFRWLGKDLFAISTAPQDKDASTAALAGGWTGDKVLAATAAHANTSATMWMVVHKERDIEQLGAKMTGMYASAQLAHGDLSVEAHVVLDSADAAAQIAKQATAMMPTLASSPQIPPAMHPIVKTLAIRSAGKELVASAHAKDTEILEIIKTLSQ